jgi:hypothetical protein
MKEKIVSSMPPSVAYLPTKFHEYLLIGSNVIREAQRDRQTDD